MALTLRAALSADASTVLIAGTDEAYAGQYFSIDSEKVAVRRVSTRPDQPTWQTWSVLRGVEGTQQAEHADGASVAATTGGGVTGAPTDATYLVAAAHADLSAEVVVTAAGLALLDDAAASNQRTTLGLGTAAVEAAGAFEAAGGIATHAAAGDPHAGYRLESADHSHASTGAQAGKLAQANTHETPDTDTGTGSLHHTIGAGANQSAAGDHTHAGSGPLASVVVNLSAGQIATLNSVPVQVLAAPGANKVIVPVAASFQYKGNTEPFAAGAPLQLLMAGVEVSASGGLSLDEVIDEIAMLAPIPSADAQAGDFANEALMLVAEDPTGLTGSILTASLGEAGTGYDVGDTGTVLSSVAGGVDAEYEIDSVGGGGEVETFTITPAGTRYAVGTVGTAVVTGAGDGAFTVDIDSITPLSDGTARLQVLYYVMDLAT